MNSAAPRCDTLSSWKEKRDSEKPEPVAWEPGWEPRPPPAAEAGPKVSVDALVLVAAEDRPPR